MRRVCKFHVEQGRPDDAGVRANKAGTSALRHNADVLPGVGFPCVQFIQHVFVVQGPFLQEWEGTRDGFALVDGELPFVFGTRPRVATLGRACARVWWAARAWQAR